MRTAFIPPLVLGLLLLLCAVTPVHADTITDFAQDASRDFLGFDITDAKPAYQRTTQDWITEANSQKARCTYFSGQYNQRLYTYVVERSAGKPVPDNWKNPTAEQRSYVMSTGFHTIDPEAARLYNEMMESCAAADKAYRKAYELTGEDDYTQHAEIFDEAAGVYDAIGNEKGADEVRDAAAVARGHAAAGANLPLPWWLAVLAVTAGLIIFRRTQR
jgi:hypothetical protein